MPDEGNGAEASRLERLRSILLDARRELIDLTRRNRLLHAPRSGKRPHCLEIIEVDPDELFTGLTRTGKQFGFAPVPDRRLVAPETASARNHRAQTLQTNLEAEPLNRRLLKFFREARTFEEEQGVNILYLALGVLTWYEDDRSDEACSAPLLLVPVALERRQGRDAYIMRGRDDDIIINASLAEKLRTFGITLPDIPDDDEWLPSAYFALVSAAVGGQTRWEVSRAAVGLGFFTFSKFLMWRDLDPAAWPQPPALLSNQLIQTLLGDDTPGDLAPPLVADDQPIEPHIDLTTAIHVLNADSSQAVCIEEARAGRNLVVQGPPGTGKSQTIANVIAAAACEGKSVLFIAEKAAALDVVSGRLKSVGLAPLCLELHSRKATRASVIASLERSVAAAGAVQLDGRTSADLRKARDALTRWSQALHRGIRRSGRTPYHVMGTVLREHARGTRILEQRLDAASDWDRDRLAEAERAVEVAALSIKELGCAPVEHVWYGIAGEKPTPFEAQRLRAALDEGLDHAKTLDVAVKEATALLKDSQSITCAQSVHLAEVLKLLSRVPKIGREALRHDAWCSEIPRVQKLIESGKTWSAAIANVGEPVVGRALMADVVSARKALGAYGNSVFRLFNGSYRRAIAEFQRICEAPLPARLENRLSLLDTLIGAQAARRLLDQERIFGQAALGPIWAADATSWTDAEALLAWTSDAQRMAPDLSVVQLGTSVDEASCATLATKITVAVASLRLSAKKIADIVRPDVNTILGVANFDDAPLASLISKLDGWSKAIDLLNPWILARDALARLDEWGMHQVSDGLRSGTISASEVRSVVDLLIAEALWRAALLDDPLLDQIDGSSRNETVANFRSLDRKRIELSRKEVLARYFERRPTGAAGEMGIVRAEMGKRRRHLPVRKLLERAGAAVQRLKPIFLMSPLSVAQFLPPGRFTFDLVVIDEASQVPPEEALGAIGRARQLLVVGDDKQLPPTNFFRMVSVDDGDDGANEIVASSSHARNFESILTLGRARGMPERMLRWHYRSRHPSLIALSNQSCYSGSLLLPPSPILDRDGLGLSLIKTPRGHYDRGGSGRNPVEADIVAEAVERHFAKWPDRSLGVACFSVAQRDAIEDALHERGLVGATDAFAPNDERFFVKNLESVQGDERDVIFISIGYGPDAEGRMTFGFGPLSADGGERRLNVLISRARFQCVVFSPITAGDIPADVKPRGTRMLRDFLHFAESGHIAAGQAGQGDFDSPFEEAVATCIRRAGYNVVPQVGVSGFRIDLGVLRPHTAGRFVLGIECDGASYHSGRSARDRDRLRQEVLEGLGWKLYRIWSTDWFRSPDREAERMLAAIQQACSISEVSISNRMPEVGPDPDIEPDRIARPKKQTQPTEAFLAQPYRTCALHVPNGATLFAVGLDKLTELVSFVAQEEGPIHIDEIARRIREAFGLERTGQRIIDAVRAALDMAARRGLIRKDGEFWFSKNAALMTPRSRRDVSSSLRRPDRIAPIEYRLAIEMTLRSCVSASKAELTAAVARVLGFDRTGNELDKSISDQIQVMFASGEIRNTEGRLELTAE